MNLACFQKCVFKPILSVSSDSDQDENDSSNEADSPLSPAASEDVPTTNGTDTAPSSNSTCTISDITQNQNNNTEDNASSTSSSKKDSDNDKSNPQRLKEEKEDTNNEKGDNQGTKKGDGSWQEDDDKLLCNGFVDASDGSEGTSDRLEEVKKSQSSMENGSKASSTSCKYP